MSIFNNRVGSSATASFADGVVWQDILQHVEGRIEEAESDISEICPTINHDLHKAAILEWLALQRVRAEVSHKLIT